MVVSTVAPLAHSVPSIAARKHPAPGRGSRGRRPARETFPHSRLLQSPIRLPAQAGRRISKISSLWREAGRDDRKQSALVPDHNANDTTQAHSDPRSRRSALSTSHSRTQKSGPREGSRAERNRPKSAFTKNRNPSPTDAKRVAGTKPSRSSFSHFALPEQENPNGIP